MWINQAWNATRWTTYGSKVQVFDGSPYLVDTSLQELSMGKDTHTIHGKSFLWTHTSLLGATSGASGQKMGL